MSERFSSIAGVSFLKMLVDAILISGDDARIQGSTELLAVAVQRSQEAGPDQVSSFGGE